jgi:hypothetical protein
MNISIDFEKSIRRKRLCYLGTRQQRLLLSAKNHLSGILLLLLCLAGLIFAWYDDAGVPVLMFIVLLSLLVIISMFLQNKLAWAESSQPQEAQRAIIRSLFYKYPGIIRHNCSEKIIIMTRPRKSFFNKEVLVLHDGQHIYMNISLGGQEQLKYMFMSISHYFICRAILKSSRKATPRNAFSISPVARAVI